jgi:GT2 family glycosyltransferase
MYWEDVSFSRHVRLRRLPLITAPDIIINHNEPSPNMSLPPHKIYYLVRNGAIFLASETPLFWRGYWWLGNRLRYIYHRLRGHQPIVTKALGDALKQTTGPIVSSNS